MQKDELIQLHTFLLLVRQHMENIKRNADEHVFSSYEKLNIRPHQLYKTKDEQKRAIFLLSEGILKMMQG